MGHFLLGSIFTIFLKADDDGITLKLLYPTVTHSLAQINYQNKSLLMFSIHFSQAIHKNCLYFFGLELPTLPKLLQNTQSVPT